MRNGTQRPSCNRRRNFPVESMGKNAITIRCDGHGVPEILEAILKVFPLDTYVEHPVNLMEVMPGDDVETPIWDTYKEIIRKYDDRGDAVVGNIERFAFYDEAKTATASSPQVKKLCMQTLCCRKVLSSTINHRPSFLLKCSGLIVRGIFSCYDNYMQVPTLLFATL